MVSKKAAIVSGGIGAVLIGGIAAVAMVSKAAPVSPPSPYSIVLSGPTNGVEGADEMYTATVTNGNIAVSGIPVTLVDKTTNISSSPVNTDSNGKASFTVTFSAAKVYTLYATAEVPQ